MRVERSERRKLSKGELERLRNVFASEPDTSDIPESSDEALAQARPLHGGMFTPEQLTKIAMEAKAQRVTRPVTVRLPVSVIEKYKKTGKGYTSLMSEILKEASRAL